MERDSAQGADRAEVDGRRGATTENGAAPADGRARGGVRRSGASSRFLREAVGAYRTSAPYAVEAANVEAYAAAVGASATETSAPPLFVVVPAWHAALEAVRLFDTAASRAEVSAMGLHESQDMTMTRALRVGDVVTTRSAVVGLRATPLGAKVLVRTETADAAGAVLAEQHSTTFFLDERDRYECGDMTQPGRALPRRPERPPDAVARRPLTRDMALAYAAASNDRSDIHTDDEAARRIGLPGIIVHGMCLVAIVCEQYRETARPRRTIEAAHVRFARPASPGMTMVTRIWYVSDDVAAFEAAAEDGTPLLRRGYLRSRA